MGKYFFVARPCANKQVAYIIISANLAFKCFADESITYYTDQTDCEEPK